MRVLLTRRRMVALAASGVALGTRPTRGRAVGVGARDLCFWRKLQGPLCSGGRAKEYWCEHCNDPGTGSNPTRCEWRLVGDC